MDCYILLVQEPSGTYILVSSDLYASPGDLAQYADGNIGRIEQAQFCSANLFDLLTKAVDVYPAEMLYMPNPIFTSGAGNDK